MTIEKTGAVSSQSARSSINIAAGEIPFAFAGGRVIDRLVRHRTAALQ